MVAPVGKEDLMTIAEVQSRPLPNIRRRLTRSEGRSWDFFVPCQWLMEYGVPLTSWPPPDIELKMLMTMVLDPIFTVRKFLYVLELVCGAFLTTQLLAYSAF